MIHFWGLVLLLVVASCGDRSNLRLDVVPGQDRAVAERALKSTKYCRLEPREQSKQSYVRCGIKGLELGESWVVIDYDPQASVQRARRMEHFESADRAMERWNALVAERTAVLGDESLEARAQLARLGEAPQGALVWKAWRTKNRDNVIGVYFVRSSDPQDPQVVEVIRSDLAQP